MSTKDARNGLVGLMADKSNAADAMPEYSSSDIENLEKLSMEKSDEVISAIENAMAVWDASKEKPAGLELRLNRLRYLYEALVKWETKMLRYSAKKNDLAARVERLKEFSGICRRYA